MHHSGYETAETNEVASSSHNSLRRRRRRFFLILFHELAPTIVLRAVLLYRD